MTWNEVASSRAAFYDAAPATSVACTMGASVPIGSLMWAAVCYIGAASGHITGMTGGGTWSMVGSEVQVSGPDYWISLWKCVATSTAAHTATATFDDSRSGRTIFMGAWTGNDAAGATDGSNQVSRGSGIDNHPSVTFATTTNGDLLIGVSINDNGDTATAGSGFSAVVTGGVALNVSQETQVQSTANGTTVVDMTLGGNRAYALVGAAFKADGGSSTARAPGKISTVGKTPMQIRPSTSNRIVIS